MDGWPSGVLRAKGFVHLAEDPQRRHVFQLVGRRWSLVPDRDWGSERPQSRIVLIGLAGHCNPVELLEPLARSRAAA